MKKISILTVGSRGDVEPFLALGKKLVEAGYKVRLVTHPEFMSLADEYRTSLSPVRLTAKEFLTKTMQPPPMNFLSLVRVLRSVVEPLLKSLLTDMWLAAKGSDVIISSGTALWGLDIAEKLAVPHVLVGLQPLLPTGDFPHVLMPDWLNGGLLNKLSASTVGILYWQVVSRSINTWRKDVLNLSERNAPFSESAAWAEQLHLLAYSPAVIPQPKDWRGNVHTTGYWTTENSERFTPDPQLVNFISSGPKPVYVGFGSMIYKDVESTLETVVSALNRTHQRGVISFKQEHIKNTRLPDSIINTGTTSHRWLFPQVSAVIHHGGAGTTASALLAGVPSLVVPFFGDQPFWAKRIAELGLSPQPIPKKELSPEKLASGIQKILESQEMRQRSQEIGAQVRSEQGIDRAVALIQAHLSQ